MKYESHEELIGAYLDGELTPSEQIRVEQLLDENPELRQLYEELRALQHSLAALPRHRLNEDLGPCVLRLAEREMLVGPRGSQEPDNDQFDSGRLAVELPERTEERFPRGWRPWIWPVAALAAALLILVSNWEKQPANQPNDVAQSGRPAPVGSIGAPPPKKPGLTTDGSALAGTGVDKATQGKKAQDPAEDSKQLARDGEDARTPQTPAPIEPPAPGERNSNNDAKIAVGKGPSSVDTPSTVPDKPQDTPLTNGADPPQKGRDNPLFPASSGASFAEGMLIVKCDIRAEAVRNKTFQKLLADQHIPWRDSQQEAGDGGPDVLSMPEAAVYVEATTLQVRNVLFELMERSSEFASVETRPQPGVAAHRVFLVYNRPNPAGGAAPPSTVAKSGTPAGVNARTLPKVFSDSPPGNTKPAIEPGGREPQRKSDPPRTAKPAKSPATKKRAAAASPPNAPSKAAAENGEDQPNDAAAGREPESSLLDQDNPPLRVLFMLRLVDHDGKPVTSGP